MQQAKILRRLLVLSHGVSNARSGVDAGEVSSDERQEYGYGLTEHEGSPTSGA